MYGRLDRLARLKQGRTISDLPGQGPEGWYEFRPEQVPPGAAELYYWTLDRTALDLLPETPPWVRYLDGEDGAYPEEALRADLEDLQSKVERMRADVRTPDTTLSDDPNGHEPSDHGRLGPADAGRPPGRTDGLSTALPIALLRPDTAPGGATGAGGGAGRADDRAGVTVQLVNLDPIAERTVIVQGGAYAEHQITTVHQEDRAGSTAVHHPHVAVRLSPRAGARLVVSLQRYANQPTLSFPWAQPR